MCRASVHALGRRARFAPSAQRPLHSCPCLPLNAHTANTQVRRYLSLLRGLQLDVLLKELQQLLRQGGTLAATGNTTSTTSTTSKGAAAATPVEAMASALGSGAGRGKGGLAGGGAAAAAAGAAGAGGGRSSFSLPSRECVVHVMGQVLKGTAVVRGMQGPLERCGAQLCAQMALTYFLPFATVAMGMLARIKVRCGQIAVGCCTASS